MFHNYNSCIDRTGICSCRVSSHGESLDLAPAEINASPDYWCAWNAQDYASVTLSVLHSLSLSGNSLTAGNLNEANLFSRQGWPASLPEELKENLFMLLDLGWDRLRRGMCRSPALF